MRRCSLPLNRRKEIAPGLARVPVAFIQRATVLSYAYCKRIRDDQDYWRQIEHYLSEHSDARFSHGICPECLKQHMPEK